MKRIVGPALLVAAICLCLPALASSLLTQKSAPSDAQTAQVRFDALIQKIAQVGIVDEKKLAQALHVQWIAVPTAGDVGYAPNLKAVLLDSGTLPVSVEFERQFEIGKAGKPLHLTAAILSVYFADKDHLSAENLRRKHERPVYFLPPESRNLAYFVINDIAIYLKYSDTPENSEQLDELGDVSKVIFVWNNQHVKPKFHRLVPK